MIPQQILSFLETHNTQRQKEIYKQAQNTAHVLRSKPGVIGIILSGSSARGPVNEASDLDLHIIVSNDHTPTFPEWTFYKDGAIENLHTVRENKLLHGWRIRNNPYDLAAWFYKTRLGDELHGFVPLWWDSSSRWQKDLLILISHRYNQEITQIIAQHYIAAAQTQIYKGKKAFNEEAFYDCHQCLRLAFQSSLIAALITRGWIIRGSKKRIEIAQAFLPDPLIEPLLDIGLDVINLTDMTPGRAKAICKARLQYRTSLLNELHKLKLRHTYNKYINNKLELAIKNQTIHNTTAYNYYSPLIKQGIVLGPINHIRCLSGMPDIPRLLITCLCKDNTWPIRKLVKSTIISPNICNDWLNIMALSSSRVRCNHLLSTLSATVDNLKRRIIKQRESL